MAYKITFSLAAIALSLTGIHSQATEVLLTFENPPSFEIPQFGGTLLEIGNDEWGTQEDGIDNNVDETDPLGLIPPVPIWNPGGWIQPIGTEAPDNNLGPVGPNVEGLDPFSIKTNQFTGVIIYNGSSWGDVSTATHVTMDVKGSFAGSGGITVRINHKDAIHLPGSDGPWWSWGAAATDASIGANPGDVTDWTTVLIPINRPEFQTDGQPPAEEGEAGVGGNWGTWGDFDNWDLVFADVNVIAVTGITPDTQILNLGFVLPDTVSGDYNDNGLVEQGDLDLVLLNWGVAWPPEIAGWINQQPTDDGVIDQNDLDGVLLNWGNSAATVSSAPVPEPCSAWLAIPGLMAMVTRLRYRPWYSRS